jgi:adenylate kinase family enzyme
MFVTINTFVHGCSGSGKSTVARRLAEEFGLLHIDLDAFAFEPDEPTTMRPSEVTAEIVRAHIGDRSAVIEGIYVDVVQLLVTDADTLVFLDMDVAVCRAHCLARPYEPHKFPTPDAQAAWLPELLDFVDGWPAREGQFGRPAHVALFDAHRGPKRRATQPVG